MIDIEKRRKEFDEHVWNHSLDPFQVAFDFKEDLSPWEIALFSKLVDSLSVGEIEFSRVLTKEIKEEPLRILPILQIVGLTRSKILTDLKAMGLKVPSKPQGLIAKPDLWKHSIGYLGSRLTKVLKPMSEMDSDSRRIALEALNQATWPGWIRQERAKRQGHEAEGRIAQMLFNLGLSFEPKEKATNPMCKDVQLNGVSFDLVAPRLKGIGLCIKSTVQTSNIGQFGESKGALEVIEAKQMLESSTKFKDVVLMAMVDGIGFQTNTAGLHGILENVTEFCQFATLWKAAVVAGYANNKIVELYIPDSGNHMDFIDRYRSSIELIEESDDKNMIRAGEGLVRLLQ